MTLGGLAVTRVVLAIASAWMLMLTAAAARAEAPRLPARAVDMSEPANSGRTIPVGSGANLQRELDRAQPGDTLLLAPGAVFGPIMLPAFQGSGWITIRSSGDIPAPGTRVGPGLATRMPQIIATRGPAIRAALNAHNFRFIGIELRPREGEFVNTLVELGENAMLTEELPHDITFSRCYFHGDAKLGGRRGIALNGASTAIVDSYFSDFKEQGADSQAIAGWSGTGPFLIANNYIEGAGENLLFGGADGPGADRIPSDIVIRGNTFVKPLEWKQGTPRYAGAAWSVKNILELKDARRVLIEGNVFDRNWAQSQNGFAILFTVRNQEGTAPWSVVEDVTFASNIVRNAGGGINILGRDDSHGGQSEQTRRIAIRGNRFENIGGDWGGTGALFQILQGTADISIEHNTALQSGSIIVSEGPPNTGFVFQSNIVRHNEYGITGTGAGIGTPALTTYFPGAVVEGNVFIGGAASRYPANNLFAPSVEAVFADAEHLHPRQPYAGAGAQVTPAPEAHAAR